MGLSERPQTGRSRSRPDLGVRTIGSVRAGCNFALTPLVSLDVTPRRNRLGPYEIGSLIVPRVLFESAVFDSDPIGQGYANYDVSLDGKRFLMIRSHNGNH